MLDKEKLKQKNMEKEKMDSLENKIHTQQQESYTVSYALCSIHTIYFKYELFIL